MEFTSLQAIALTVLVIGIYIVGMFCGREWGRVETEEFYEDLIKQEKQKNDNYYIN